MRYLNNFEGLKIGDHIIGHGVRYTGTIKEFFENNVGKIVNINGNLYYIKFDFVPNFVLDYSIDGEIFAFLNDEIRRATSEEQEKQELKNSTLKYNL